MTPVPHGGDYRHQLAHVRAEFHLRQDTLISSGFIKRMKIELLGRRTENRLFPNADYWLRSRPLAPFLGGRRVICTSLFFAVGFSCALN